MEMQRHVGRAGEPEGLRDGIGLAFAGLRRVAHLIVDVFRLLGIVPAPVGPGKLERPFFLALLVHKVERRER